MSEWPDEIVVWTFPDGPLHKEAGDWELPAGQCDADNMGRYLLATPERLAAATLPKLVEAGRYYINALNEERALMPRRVDALRNWRDFPEGEEAELRTIEALKEFRKALEAAEAAMRGDSGGE